MLDVGTDGSNLIITDGGKIIWQRPIPIGGNHFTRALTKELKLTFAKAEHLKRNAAKSPELANILKALKPVLTDFVGEVQRSLGYFTNTHRDAQVEYLVGLGSAFKLPGLQKYLGDKLQLRVEKPSKYPATFGRVGHQRAGVHRQRAHLPGRLRSGLAVARRVAAANQFAAAGNIWDRKIRFKKPWAVAAAACLLIGTGMLAFGYSVPLAAVNDPKIGDSLNRFNKAKTDASSVDQQIKEKQEDTKKNVANTQAIIAGKDEHLNWAAHERIHQFVSAGAGPERQHVEGAAVKTLEKARAAPKRQRRNTKTAFARASIPNLPTSTTICGSSSPPSTSKPCIAASPPT